jgi:hypothetical protein
LKYAVVIHFPISTHDLKKWGEDLDKVTLMARHPEAFLTEDGEPILFDSVEKANEEGQKMMKRLPPIKYSFSIINVR